MTAPIIIQECIPVGCVPPAHWPYLVVSYPCNHAHPPTTHALLQPCMPPCNHACPPATTHAPLQPHMPPLQPRMPLATTHAHNHACPPATMHTPQQPCTPPQQPHMPPATMHTPPPATIHTPWQPCTPLWTEFLTHASENITLPQTSFAGGNNESSVNKRRSLRFIYIECKRTQKRIFPLVIFRCSMWTLNWFRYEPI